MWPAIISALASAGSGIGSWLGQRNANEENKKLSREQMAFQERMSSTAAQRSVEDYTKAGLNPALAYDRPASSPAGSLSRVEDAVGKGISTALQARALNQSMEIARQQSQADLQLKQSQSVRNAAEGATAVEQGDFLRHQKLQVAQQLGFRTIDQPFETRLKAARALVEEYGLAGARNVSGFENRMGQWSPGLKFVLGSASQAARILPGLGITR